MKMKELLAKLRVLKVKAVYIIHKENPTFHELCDLRRFEELLRESGFIPALAIDYRRYGKDVVSRCISLCDFSIVLALDSETERTAREQGVDFVTVEGI